MGLAAQKGQHLAQAQLGEMLFNGDRMRPQAARGLMFLTLACESATPDEVWIKENYNRAVATSTEDERAMAVKMSSSGCRAAATDWRKQLDRCRERGRPMRRPFYSQQPVARLDRRAWNRPIRTKDAAVAGLRLQPRSACPAVIEKLAGIDRHRLGGLMAASGAGDGRIRQLPPAWRRGRSRRLEIEIGPNRHVIGRLLPGAHIAVDADIDQPVAGLRRHQQMIDAQAPVLLPGAGLIIPEGVLARARR